MRESKIRKKDRVNFWLNKNAQNATSTSTVHPLYTLHQTIGNQSIQRLIKYSGIRIMAKLTIGAPDDIYEQEAERVSEQVMRMTDEEIVQKNPG